MFRVWLVIPGTLVLADTAVWAAEGWFVSWWFPLVQGVATALLGLGVIGWASWRYGKAIAARLDDDLCLDGRLVDGPLLLLAGILLILPGLLADLFGLALLARPVRQLIVMVLQRSSGLGPG